FMPVQDYGVVIGQFDHFDRDDANHYGSFYHGHIFVRAPGAAGDPVLYNCAVDVKYPAGNVEYFEPKNLDALTFAVVSSRPNGFHSLASTPSSGALDYVRGQLVSAPLGCLALFYVVLNWFTRQPYHEWQQNVGMSALTDLEAFLAAD